MKISCNLRKKPANAQQQRLGLKQLNTEVKIQYSRSWIVNTVRKETKSLGPAWEGHEKVKKAETLLLHSHSMALFLLLALRCYLRFDVFSCISLLTPCFHSLFCCFHYQSRMNKHNCQARFRIVLDEQQQSFFTTRPLNSVFTPTYSTKLQCPALQKHTFLENRRYPVMAIIRPH